MSAEVLCGLWQNYGPENKGERYRRGRIYPPSRAEGGGGEDETCIEGGLQGNGSQKSTARKRVGSRNGACIGNNENLNADAFDAMPLPESSLP